MKFKIGDKVETWEKRHDDGKWGPAEVVGMVGNSYSVKFEDRFGGYWRDEDQVRALPAPPKFKAGDRVVTVDGLKGEFLHYSSGFESALIRINGQISALWHTITGLTYDLPEKPDLRDAVVEAALACSGFEPSVSVLLQAAEEYRKSLIPLRCEPPEEHKDERYHWVTGPSGGESRGVYQWTGAMWLAMGSGDVFPAEWFAERGYVWHSVAKPGVDHDTVARIKADVERVKAVVDEMGSTYAIRFESMAGSMGKIGISGGRDAMKRLFHAILDCRNALLAEQPSLQPAKEYHGMIPPKDCAVPAAKAA